MREEKSCYRDSDIHVTTTPVDSDHSVSRIAQILYYNTYENNCIQHASRIQVMHALMLLYLH